MNREIKFRGKSVRNGNWLYAVLHGLGMDLFDETVYDDSIGQYTGLKDCNGNEIYEGDFIQIKKYPESEPLLVEYNYGGFGYMYFGEFYLFGGNPNFTFKPFNTDDDFEIIGNIHDNPELLKTKQI